MLFQTCTQLTFGLSDVFVVIVTARNRINGVGSLFFHDRILRFGENMPQSLKRFLSNFNVVAIQTSLDGFRNILNVRNKSKTSRWFPFIRSATSCNWFFAVTQFLVILREFCRLLLGILITQSKIPQKPFQTRRYSPLEKTYRSSVYVIVSLSHDKKMKKRRGPALKFWLTKRQSKNRLKQFIRASKSSINQ